MKHMIIVVPLALAPLASMAQSGTVGTTDTEIEQDARQIIADKTRDPEAARFRNVVHRTTVNVAVCGEINAKNAFGGYAGYARFLQSYSVPKPGDRPTRQMGMIEEPGSLAFLFQNMWSLYCPR